MRGLRLVALGFLGGAAAAFGISLLRQRRIAAVTGYRAPDSAVGPAAVTVSDDLAIDLTSADHRPSSN